MRIQVLAEGSTPEQRVKGEWGLSMLIDSCLLFDTFGHPEILEKNIRQYGISMRKIKKVVISHNHWDHVSGLKFVLVNTKHPEVYLPQDDHKLYEFCHDCGAYVFISNNKGVEKEGFKLTGAMTARFKGEIFNEQGIMLESKRGPVLVTGCSHPGIVRMVKRAIRIEKKPVYAVIGGLHLKDKKAGAVRKIIACLKKLGVKKVIAGHCTGEGACAEFKKFYKSGFKKLKTGAVYAL